MNEGGRDGGVEVEVEGNGGWDSKGGREREGE